MSSANKKGRLKPNGSDGLLINPINNKFRIKQNPPAIAGDFYIWLREQDSNLRPSGYEPDELPCCSIPRQKL